MSSAAAAAAGACLQLCCFLNTGSKGPCKLGSLGQACCCTSAVLSGCLMSLVASACEDRLHALLLNTAADA